MRYPPRHLTSPIPPNASCWNCGRLSKQVPLSWRRNDGPTQTSWRSRCAGGHGAKRLRPAPTAPTLTTAFTTPSRQQPTTGRSRASSSFSAHSSRPRKATWDRTGYAVGITEVGHGDHAAILQAIESADAVQAKTLAQAHAARAGPSAGAPHRACRNHFSGSMNMQSATFFEALAHILPADCLKTAAEDMRPYECDGLSMYRALPKVRCAA